MSGYLFASALQVTFPGLLLICKLTVTVGLISHNEILSVVVEAKHFFSINIKNLYKMKHLNSLFTVFWGVLFFHHSALLCCHC